MENYAHDCYKYEFIETRHGRVLVFQNYSYARVDTSLFNCSSRKSRLCDARVMLDNRKLVILSADHNHLPPFLTRNENGTVTSYLTKSQIRQRREKPTLGPRATRYEVDCLVASIKQEMEFNRKQATEPPVEAEVAPNNKSVAPRIVVRDLSSETKTSVSEAGTPISEVEASTSEDKTLVKPNEGLPKIKIDMSSLTKKTHQNEFASYVYNSTTNRNKALVKLMAGTLGGAPRSPHPSVVKKLAISHELDSVEPSHKPLVSTAEENPIVGPTGVDESIKQEHGLLPNQMYIVLPPANNDAGKAKHNRFIIPSTQNTDGTLSSNKILLSPVKTEPNSGINAVQAKRNEPSGLTGNILNKGGNTVTTNKMFIVVRTSDCGTTLQNNENVTRVTDKVKNKMFFIVHNKNEKNVAVAPATDALPQLNQNTVSVSSSIISPLETTAFNDIKKNKLITQKTVLKTPIPISSIKNINLPLQSDSDSEVITKNTMSSKNPDVITVAGPSRMKSFPPKTLNLSSNINITSVPETGNQQQMRGEKGSVIPILPITIPKRTETVNVLRKKTHTIMPIKINMMTQPLPSDLILDGKNMPVNQVKAPRKNNETIISSGSCKTAVNEGNIQQANNLIEKVSSMLPLKSPKQVQNTFEMQNNMQYPVRKNIEIHSPGCNKQQVIEETMKKTGETKNDIVAVKTEVLEVSDDLQTNLSNKTETECEDFKQSFETGIVSSGTEQPTGSKQQLIMPDEELQIIQSVPNSKQPIVSKATEDSMEIHLTQNITTEANESPMKIDLDWIVPRNKDAVQTKINTNFTSKDLKQMPDNAFNFGKTSNIPEVSIPVSMIPLPDESSPLVSNTSTVLKTVGNNERGLVSVGTPVVRIERLSMKRKAGNPSMYSVPPKKRHYQP